MTLTDDAMAAAAIAGEGEAEHRIKRRRIEHRRIVDKGEEQDLARCVPMAARDSLRAAEPGPGEIAAHQRDAQRFPWPSMPVP
ncbi:MAG: hypothetical protein U1E15_01730 [Hyphomicrobiales bacterium]